MLCKQKRQSASQGSYTTEALKLVRDSQGHSSRVAASWHDAGLMDSLHLSPYTIYLTGMPIHTLDLWLLCCLEVVKKRSRSCVLQLFFRLKRLGRCQKTQTNSSPVWRSRSEVNFIKDFLHSVLFMLSFCILCCFKIRILWCEPLMCFFHYTVIIIIVDYDVL